MHLLLVGLAGGAGAGLRFLIDAKVNEKNSLRDFPLGTLVVNVSACFLIGLIAANLPNGDWNAILATGLVGGYSTFSTASLDAAKLFLARHGFLALAHVTLMFIFSYLALLLGLLLKWN